MTPRERLLAALDRREPDNPPLDLGATATTTITALPYARLRRAMGLPELRPTIFSFTAQSVKPDEDLLERLGVDTRAVKPQAPAAFKPVIGDDGEYERYTDEWGIGYRRPKAGGLYFDMCSHPLAGKSREEILAHAFPHPDDPVRIRGLKEQCAAIRARGYPVVFGQSFGYGTLHTGSQLMGYEDYFTRLALEPDTIQALTARILEGKLRFWQMVLGELGGLIDVVAEADDLGTQRGPLLDPAQYRRLIKPFHKELFAGIKRMAPRVKIFFHSCGSVDQFIPDLIEMGVDALNPVQISATGMDPVRLKREFGRDIAFWGGGIDTQASLPSASPAEVAAEARRRVEVLAKGGGYVFATVHNIQADVPPENIIALYRAFDELRR